MMQPLMRLDHFMAQANAAYYGQGTPFSDFTTAPEISQLFGEMLAVWCVQTWQALGCPNPFHLVEASFKLRDTQKQTLISAYQEEKVFWHSSFEGVPKTDPLIVIGNEFFDALPIRQFVYSALNWQERYVQGEEWQDCPLADWPNGLQQVLYASVATQEKEQSIWQKLNGQDATLPVIVECNEAAQAIIADLSKRLTHGMGAALFIDYGFVYPECGDTLQALYHGQPSSPLHHQGQADLTAHVDFYTLGKIARFYGCRAGFETQKGFLSQLGISTRVSQLLSGKGQAIRQTILEGYTRLTGTEKKQMGTLFKVMVMASPSLTDIIGV